MMARLCRQTKATSLGQILSTIHHEPRSSTKVRPIPSAAKVLEADRTAPHNQSSPLFLPCNILVAEHDPARSACENFVHITLLFFGFEQRCQRIFIKIPSH